MTVKDEIHDLEERLEKTERKVNKLWWILIRCTAGGFAICGTAATLGSWAVDKWKPLTAGVIAYMKADGKL